MPHFSTTKRVNLTAEQAFAIAADVTSYKDFLPLLERSTIRGERTNTNDGESFDADLTIGYSKLGVRESFKSHVVCDGLSHTVTATSSDGPMKSLKAVWKIVQTADGKTEVSIVVDYVLKSTMLQLMVRGLMDFAAQKIMQAFEERGRLLYSSRLT
jgi:coenzyme Q-binding protein COQ10